MWAIRPIEWRAYPLVDSSYQGWLCIFISYRTIWGRHRMLPRRTEGEGMDRGTRIAVLGAGLAGLTAAALLQKAGFSVAIYEQTANFSRIGAGIILGANVAKVLRRLNLEHE